MLLRPTSLLLALALVHCVGQHESEAGHRRVATAQRQSLPRVKQALQRAGLGYPVKRVFLRVFKQEKLLELWGSHHRKRFRLIKRYPICAASGELGPKRRQGDLQVPEGFYRIDLLNPWSAYHLSMRINYPNRSDRLLGYKPNLGGAIMIHGNCVSIGCIAITDRLVEEVYLVVRSAWRNGQRKIPVHIFPFRLEDVALKHRTTKTSPALIRFWQELQPGYRYFQRHRQLPRIRVDRRGHHKLLGI